MSLNEDYYERRVPNFDSYYDPPEDYYEEEPEEEEKKFDEEGNEIIEVTITLTDPEEGEEECPF